MTDKGRRVVALNYNSSCTVLAGVKLCFCRKTDVCNKSGNEVEGHILACAYNSFLKIKLCFRLSYSLRLFVSFRFLFVIMTSFLVLGAFLFLTLVTLLTVRTLALSSVSFLGVGKLHIRSYLSGLNTYNSEDTLASCVEYFEFYVIKSVCAKCCAGIFLCFNDVFTHCGYFFYHCLKLSFRCRMCRFQGITSLGKSRKNQP